MAPAPGKTQEQHPLPHERQPRREDFGPDGCNRISSATLAEPAPSCKPWNKLCADVRTLSAVYPFEVEHVHGEGEFGGAGVLLRERALEDERNDRRFPGGNPTSMLSQHALI